MAYSEHIDFFISRRGASQAVAQEIADVLGSAGYTVLLQDHDIPYGSNFVEAVHEALKRCQNFIAVISKDYDASRFTRDEWTNFYAAAAQSNGKRRLIAVRTDDCVLDGLFAAVVFADLAGIVDRDERRTRILNAAEGRATGAPPTAMGRRDKIATGQLDRAPHTKSEQIKNFLKREVSVVIDDHEPITGNLCDVYFGSYGEHKVAIKVFRNSELTGDAPNKLSSELKRTSKLTHPAFLRIMQILRDNHLCFVVDDYVEGGETIAARLNKVGQFPAKKVCDILGQLSAAVVQAERVGLKYLSITPSQIFIRDVDAGRSIVRLSPINFELFKSRVIDTGMHWTNEAGPFIAPELWDEAPNDEERVLARLNKANQFALGMLALTMLEGGIP